MSILILLVSVLVSFCGFTQNDSIIHDNEISKSKYGNGVYDIDGNKYKTVIIGKQEWMAENLKVTKFNDGTLIQNIRDTIDWIKFIGPAWCYNENDSLKNLQFGKLYNWYVVSSLSKNVCPTGWHVPSEKDWSNLVGSQGEKKYAADKLKYAESNLWLSNNESAINSSLFSVTPGGFRYSNGQFMVVGYGAYFWSSDDFNKENDGVLLIVHNESSVGGYGGIKKNDAYSIRCLKD